MTEESILGYDLYSSALSEILSEPSLHLPITVGLYAKWGSGKSFLLSQLKNEMKSFARLTKVIKLDFDLFLILSISLSLLTLISPFFFWHWSYGLILYTSILFGCFCIIGTAFFIYMFHSNFELLFLFTQKELRSSSLTRKKSNGRKDSARNFRCTSRASSSFYKCSS